MDFSLAELMARPGVGLSVLAVAGIFAGVINAMAGGGSFLTIPLLMALGIPAGTTNGTIRVGVLLQNIAATAAFHRKGVREYGTALRYLVPMGVGAAAGSVLASQIDDAVLKPLFGGVFIVWAVILLIKPGRFSEEGRTPREPGPVAYLIALGIGIYGGFIQAGVGFPLIAFLVLYLGFDPVRSNAIKVLLVGMYTLVVIPVFAYTGKVAWLEAGVLAGGTMVGGWLGARWQLRSGAKIVRWFVLVMVTISGVGMVVSAL